MNQSNAGVNPAHVAGTDFVMVHLDLLDDLGGDFHAAVLFARIQFRAGTDGWWEATQERVMEDTRLTAHQLRRALGVLRDAGYVETVRRSAYDPTLKYRVIVATTVNEENPITSSCDSLPVTEDFTITVNEDFTITPSSKNVEEHSKEPPVVPNGFDDFYRAYPKKKQPGYAREKAWPKAVKKADPAVIVAAAVAYRQWCERSNQDPQFIPYPASWLNAESWNDELPDRLSASDRRAQGFTDLYDELAYNENSPQPLELEG